MSKEVTVEQQEALDRLAPALGRLPSGLYILTAAHEDRRAGMLCSWVQQVGFEPPMISIAVGKGRSIMPLISESRAFAVSALRKEDNLLMRKFTGETDINDDPFLGHELIDNALGVPVMANTMSYLLCELTCHMDVEGDHDLFIGTVVDGHYTEGEPMVHIRKNGLKY